jgi:hypothetical protein
VRRKALSRRGRRCELGQATVEVVVVTVAMVVALCSPWVDGRSPVGLLLSALGALSGSYIDWLKVI